MWFRRKSSRDADQMTRGSCNRRFLVEQNLTPFRCASWLSLCLSLCRTMLRSADQTSCWKATLRPRLQNMRSHAARVDAHGVCLQEAHSKAAEEKLRRQQEHQQALQAQIQEKQRQKVHLLRLSSSEHSIFLLHRALLTFRQPFGSMLAPVNKQPAACSLDHARNCTCMHQGWSKLGCMHRSGSTSSERLRRSCCCKTLTRRPVLGWQIETRHALTHAQGPAAFQERQGTTSDYGSVSSLATRNLVQSIAVRAWQRYVSLAESCQLRGSGCCTHQAAAAGASGSPAGPDCREAQAAGTAVAAANVRDRHAYQEARSIGHM